jgi:hypothetical protein
MDRSERNNRASPIGRHITITHTACGMTRLPRTDVTVPNRGDCHPGPIKCSEVYFKVVAHVANVRVCSHPIMRVSSIVPAVFRQSCEPQHARQLRASCARVIDSKGTFCMDVCAHARVPAFDSRSVYVCTFMVCARARVCVCLCLCVCVCGAAMYV